MDISTFDRHHPEYHAFAKEVAATFARKLTQVGYEKVPDHIDDTILCVALDAVAELIDRLADADYNAK